MTAVDDLRRKIEGKAYPLDNETCSLLLDLAGEAEWLADPDYGAIYRDGRYDDMKKRLGKRLDALRKNA